MMAQSWVMSATYEQGDSAWAGELRCGLAGADTCSGGRLIG